MANNNKTSLLDSADYDSYVEKKLKNLKGLERSFSEYQSVPLARKSERRKRSTPLFHMFWQSALKLFTEDIEQSGGAAPLFVRSALLKSSNLSEKNLSCFETANSEASFSEDIYYMDEWLIAVGKEALTSSQKASSKRKEKRSAEAKSKVNMANITHETTQLEEMARAMLSVGQASASPFLHEEDLKRPLSLQIASKAKILYVIDLVKSIDPNIFKRVFLKETAEVEPLVVIIPSYAPHGHCWEAFDKHDRLQSKGRLCIPFYPVNTKIAVLVALAELRWETAKMVAGGYWLEKGLTGAFYDLSRKLDLGNEKHAFVTSYCHWILDESRGVMKLHEDVRRLFWEMIPFPQERREALVKYYPQFNNIVK